MKISLKLFLIQLIFIASLAVFTFAWSKYSSRQTEMFIELTHEHYEKLVDQVLASFQQRILQPLNDNSEWDRTVDYIKNPDKHFESENITTLLETFSINAVFIFNRSGELVVSVNDSSDHNLTTLLDGANIRNILSAKNPRLHSYVSRDKRIYEIFGATVVPTYDVDHRSTPAGYMLFINSWDKEYLHDLSEMTQSRVVPLFDPQSFRNALDNANKHDIRALRDYNGKITARLLFSRNDPLLDEWSNSASISLWISVLMGLLIILVIGYIFRKWISLPLLKSIDELQYSEDRFRQVAENAGEWIWEVNASGCYTYSNTIVEKILGYTPDELVHHKYWFALFPENLQETLRAEVMESINQGKMFRDFINPHVHKDGHIVTLQTSFSPFFNVSGKLMGYRGTGLNVTEHMKVMEDLKVALNKAEENDRLKTAFLNNISHEIRTPMNAIIGYSDLLKEVYNLPEKQKAYTEIISTASYQLLSIIDDIINISTLEAGQEIYRPQTFNLNVMLKRVRDQFLLKAGKKGLSLELMINLPENQAIITTDETKLGQILANLLNNAFKFTSDGHILFGYKVKNNRLEFFVKDTGIGIPMHMHELIFDRFRQADSSVIREYGGTGLGLSISKAYVELLEGRMWLESEIGKGSIFYFDIPYLQSELNHKQMNGQLMSGGILDSPFEKTILVAEDEELNYLLICEMFSNHNWKIIKAVNGEEAVKLCQSNPDIDLVLMDLKMPVMDGYEATRIIKSARPELPVIVQTAYINEQDRKKAFKNGCDDYICKPFNMNHFTEMVRKYIGV